MFGQKINTARKSQRKSIKELAQQLAIDPSLLSRIERGERTATKNQVQQLSTCLDLNYTELLKLWLQEKVEGMLTEYPEIAQEVLMAMETRIEYLTGKHALETQLISVKLQKQLERINELKKQWSSKKPSRGTQLSKLYESFAIEYTYESNRIEGNTFSLQDTYLVINQGLTISGKSVQEHLEAINHDEAIEFITDMATNKIEITEYRLKQIHHLVLKGIDRKNAGVYRTVPVRIGGSSHMPPEPYLLSKMMEDLFHFYETEKKRMHPILLAAEMHERLVSIHPFIDGNGRTARLLMNLILLKNGYEIAILKGSNSDRMEYYKALEAVQKDANPEPFHLLVAKTVKESLAAHLKMV